MTQLDDQRYWLYVAVNPETNEFLHCKLYSTRETAFTEMLLRELREKHVVEDAVFLVDSASWFKLHFITSRPNFYTRNMEIGTSSNVSFKR